MFVETVVVGAFIAVIALFSLYKVSKRDKFTAFQFGRVEKTRPGLKNHPFLDDEPNFVPYVDYKYWIRLTPNPGFNLPVIGYWSKVKGRRR